MRCLHLVTYDISSPKRWRKVFKIMKGFGQHVQLSVFLCDVTAVERIRMEAELARVIHHEEDQILIVDLGPSEASRRPVRALGRPSNEEEREARIL